MKKHKYRLGLQNEEAHIEREEKEKNKERENGPHTEGEQLVSNFSRRRWSTWYPRIHLLPLFHGNLLLISNRVTTSCLYSFAIENVNANLPKTS